MITIDWQDKNVLISIAAIVLVVILILIWSIFIKPLSQSNLVNLSGSTIQEAEVQYIQDEIIVQFKGKNPKLIKVSAGQVEAEVERYSQMDNVEYAEPNYLAHVMGVLDEPLLLFPKNLFTPTEKWTRAGQSSYDPLDNSFPNDPLYKDQWNLHGSQEGGINIEPAWDLTMVSTYEDYSRRTPNYVPGLDVRDEYYNTQVIVAVIDTGVAYEDYIDYEGAKDSFLEEREDWDEDWGPPPPKDNINQKLVRRYNKCPDFEGTCFVPGYDFVNNDTHPNDDHGHGTAVAGVIAQDTDNRAGSAGIAFRSCIMPVKVMNAMGGGDMYRVSAGIYWAADHGADIINIGFGMSIGPKILLDAIFYAWSMGITIVAPVGNHNSDILIYPAAFDPFVIGVGATDSNKNRTSYSNYNQTVDLVAPGGDIKGKAIWQSSFAGVNAIKDLVERDGKSQSFEYLPFAGTCFSAAHVSGVAALILSGQRNLDPVFVETILSATAEDLGKTGWDKQYGWGLINAEAAMNLLFYPSIGNPLPIPPDPSDVTFESFWSGFWSTAVYTFEDDAWIPRSWIDEHRFPLFNRPDFKEDPQSMIIDWQKNLFCGFMGQYYPSVL